MNFQTWNLAHFRKELAKISDVKASWQWPELPVVEKESKIEQCGCVRKIRAVKDYRAEGGGGGANASTCSLHSHDRGPQQKVEEALCSSQKYL